MGARVVVGDGDRRVRLANSEPWGLQGVGPRHGLPPQAPSGTEAPIWHRRLAAAAHQRPPKHHRESPWGNQPNPRHAGEDMFALF